MTKRAGWCALLLLILASVPLEAAKRRSVSPGAPGRCWFGVLDDEAYVGAMAMDEDEIFYVDEFDLTLYRIPREGGTRFPLTTFRSVIVTDIQLDGSDVYVATIPATFNDTLLPGTIYAVPKVGASRRTIATQVVVPTQLAIDQTHVYWVSGGTYNFANETILADGKVERIRKDGTGRETLVESLSAPFGIQLDASDVYFSESGFAEGNTSHGIRRVPKGGGSVTHLQDTHSADFFVLTDTDIYFNGGLLNLTDAGIFRIPKSGGLVPVGLAHVFGVSGGPRVAGGFVYYVVFDEEEGEDQLFRVSVGGSVTPQFVLSDLWNQYDFEVDECAVYYGNLDAQFVKARR